MGESDKDVLCSYFCSVITILRTGKGQNGLYILSRAQSALGLFTVDIIFVKIKLWRNTKKYLEHLGKIVIVWAFLGFLYDVFYSDKTIEAIRKIFQDDMFEFVRFD